MDAKLAALVALALMTFSPAAVGWGAVGSHEPDSRADRTDGWMFPDHDITPCGTTAPTYCPTNQVYLNGFFRSCETAVVPGRGAAGECVTQSPNLATLGTSFHQHDFELAALLGAWKDCNNDGYVGLGDQGLFEYRREILVNVPGVGESICPKTTTPIQPNGKPPENWTASHNDGEWVREFLPLQPRNYGSVVGDINAWNLNDDGAKVWADLGRPGAFRFSCYYASYPSGTFHSTGGLLHTFDCWDGYQVTDTEVTATSLAAPLAPFSFGDHPRDQENSASQLNLQNPWGVPRDRSYVETWDCAHPIVDQDENVTLATNDGSYVDATVMLAAPHVPPTVSTAGSPSGTMNESTAGAQRGSGYAVTAVHASDSTPAPGCGRDARTANGTTSEAPYGMETGTTLAPFKQYTDVLGASESNRPSAPLSAALGKSAPPGLGIVPNDDDGVYRGNRIYNPETVFLDADGGGLGGIAYFTFYAYVDPTAITMYHLSLPKSAYGTPLATGTYGQEACGGFTSGVHNSWDCAAVDWTSTVKVGDKYDLRDVDCDDQSADALRGQGVSWGTIDGTSC